MASIPSHAFSIVLAFQHCIQKIEQYLSAGCTAEHFFEREISYFVRKYIVSRPVELIFIIHHFTMVRAKIIQFYPNNRRKSVQYKKCPFTTNRV